MRRHTRIAAEEAAHRGFSNWLRTLRDLYRRISEDGYERRGFNTSQ